MEKTWFWELDFWESDSGMCPAADYMREMKERNLPLHRAVCKKIRLYQEWRLDNLYGAEHIKNVREELVELIITAQKSEVRFLGIIENSAGTLPQFKSFHGFQKHSQKTPKREIELALKRLAEYKKSKKYNEI